MRAKLVRERLVALDELATITAAFGQPGDLLARIAAHALKKAQHDGFIGSLQATVTEAAHRASDEIVALIGCHRKINCYGSVQKGL